MPRTLLLADGNATIHRVVALTFASEDIKVVSVSDGEQAIARITAEPPDIVLADIAMPKRNGYEVSAFVKGQPSLSHIPVLLLAGALEPVDQARAAQVHCDGVLVKPFDPHHMIARVLELVPGTKGQLPSGSAEARPQDGLTHQDAVVSQQAPSAPAAPAAAPPVATLPALALPTAVEPAVDRRDEPSLRLVRPAAPPITPAPTVRVAPPAPVKPALPPITSAPPSANQAPLATEIDGDPLADYFDQLDAAFDSLAATSPNRSKPAVSDDETDTMVVPTFNNVLGDLSREERRPVSAKSEEILFGAPTVDPADIRPVPSLSPARAPRVRAVAPPEPRLAMEPPPAPEPPPPAPEPPPRAPEPPPSPVAAPPRAHEPLWHEPAVAAEGRRSAIADAFEALLAVEEEQRMANQPRQESQPIVITDELVEAVADRVMARLAPDGFTDLISRIVTDVAERLVREEIDRIRGRK
jgi:CheY-like chemotaxis protein